MSEDPLSYEHIEGVKPPLLGRDTLVPIGLLVAVVLSSITATVWINTQLLNLNHSVASTNERIDNLRDQLANVSKQVSMGSADIWTRSDMIRWIELANAKSPQINLPSATK